MYLYKVYAALNPEGGIFFSKKEALAKMEELSSYGRSVGVDRINLREVDDELLAEIYATLEYSESTEEEGVASANWE